MKIKCYSVRLQSLTDISAKAMKATAFDGSTAIIPKSQIFGQDHEVQKSEAHWISAWILEQKELQYSSKKVSWYNTNTGRFETNIEIEHHKPKKVEFNPNENPHESLIK